MLPESAAGVPVLLVEDERELAAEIRHILQRVGYRVEHAENFAEGILAARRGDAGVLIVDRLLNGGDEGLTLVETLRSEGNLTPVLVVSALAAVDERIRGFNAGGDDYLIKPFALSELVARVGALERRAQGARSTRLKVGPLDLDLIERTARRDGEPVDLLPREFKLLEYFARRPGQVVTRAMLLEDVWGYKSLTQTNVIDVHIGHLRRKLEAGDKTRLIVNVRAAGFKLQVEP